MNMLLSDLSSDQEATGSNFHGGDVGSHGFAPAATLPLPPSLQHQPQLLEEQPKAKKKRSQPGNPDPEAEVIALSPRTLVATNRFVCEICNKGFQRDQNLQLHRRGHNLPWKLRQRSALPPSPRGGVDHLAPAPARKRVYVCPEPTCVHHDPARALGDLTGIKKHFSRKHGEKRWRCERCGKRYAVQSDWKAHVKNCGTREYRCDCGILFTRKDSLLTHRAFCDALAEESARVLAAAANNSSITTCNNSSSSNANGSLLISTSSSAFYLDFSSCPAAPNPNPNSLLFLPQECDHLLLPPFQPSPYHDDHGLPVAEDTITGTGTGSDSIAGDVADAVSFGVASEGRPVALHTGGGHCLTRDFLGVDDAGEVEELQLPLMPLCTASTATVVSRAACCATDLTRQYHGQLPPVNHTWSHNF